MIDCPHSIYFFRGDVEAFDFSTAVNTLRDWKIVPLGRPCIAPPQQKLNIIDVPGTNGVLDLSNSLTKYPVFNNRTGSLKFAALVDELDTPTIYTKIMRFLQGTNVRMILEDDSEFFYEGRVFVDNIDDKSDGTNSEISLGYDLFPYRKSIHTSTGDWLWDPFNFETDVIQQEIFTDITFNTSGTDWTDEYDFTGLIDMMPVNPIFRSSSQCEVAVYNTDLGLNWKEYTLPQGSTENQPGFHDLIFCEFTPESQVKVKFRGSATVSIDFRSGRL